MIKRFASSVSPKGQITIPLATHRQLGIKPKDTVTIEIEGNEVRVAPAAFTLESARGSVPALPRRMVVEGDGADRAGGARRVGDR